MPLKVEDMDDYDEDLDIAEDESKTSKILSKMSLTKIRQHPWSKHVHDVLHITGCKTRFIQMNGNLQNFFSGDVASVAGEAGLPFAGLVGLGLRLGARIFRSDQGDDNIRFIGQMVFQKITLL